MEDKPLDSYELEGWCGERLMTECAACEYKEHCTGEANEKVPRQTNYTVRTAVNLAGT